SLRLKNYSNNKTRDRRAHHFCAAFARLYLALNLRATAFLSLFLQQKIILSGIHEKFRRFT
ncbi:hypothetical protein, partial [Acinetobacter baumannii]|uniref:hypothetical protein n=1 Tax=Acinetobacter baumannii TaxID=470 RepID=UPI00313F14A2